MFFQRPLVSARITTTLFALLALFITPAVTKAAVFVPAGLNPGDTYQLAFATLGTIGATSPDILTYNNFVQAQAATNPELTGTDMGVNWFAIVSTVNDGAASANAVNAASDVYLLDGTQIASSGTPLYGGSILSALDIGQDGVTEVYSDVWTGSNEYGAVNNPLGHSLVASIGKSSKTNPLWLDAGADRGVDDSLPLYALSEKLTVPGGVVPEPTTFAIWSLLGGLCMAFCWWRRRER